MPYALRTIALGSRGWLGSNRRYATTCSSLGVVVNEKADVRLAEAVAQAMLDANTGEGPETSLRRLTDLVSTALGEMVRLAVQAGRMAVGLLWGAPDRVRDAVGSVQSSIFSTEDSIDETRVTLRVNGN
jgi:hypothetical protein